MGESLFVSLKVASGALTNVLVLIGILLIGRTFYRLTTKVELEKEISENDNPAMGLALAGYLVGLALAVSGAISDSQVSWEKLGVLAGVGVVSMLLMRLSLVINDKLILSRFNNLSLIVDQRNLGVGFIEAGGCVATGLMIAGVLSGKADTVEDRLLYGGIYWLVGQVALVLGAIAFRPACGYDLDNELQERNNTAAGISFGGMLVAIGFIIQAAMVGASTDVLAELATIGVFFVTGMVVLELGYYVLGKVLIPRSPMSAEVGRDKNCGAGALSAAGFIAIAVLFAAALSPATTFATFSSALKADEPVPAVAPAPAPETKTVPVPQAK